MKKLVLIVISFLVIAFPSSAHAILLDFSANPALSPTPRDVNHVDTAHVFVTEFGNITFNGCIFNAVNGHSNAAYGNFLKNDNVSKVTMNFSFGVSKLELDYFGDKFSATKGCLLFAEAYDVNDLLLGSVAGVGDEQWHHLVYTPTSPISKFVFYSENPNNNNLLVNRMAIDNINLTPVPEPATMALFGIGGIAMLLRRKKRAS